MHTLPDTETANHVPSTLQSYLQRQQPSKTSPAGNSHAHPKIEKKESTQILKKLSEMNSSICEIVDAVQHLEESTIARFRSLEQWIQHSADVQRDSLSGLVEQMGKNQKRVLQTEEQSLSMLKEEIGAGLSEIKRRLADLHKQSEQYNRHLERPFEHLISQGREHEELLKMLLVNSLGNDIEKILDSEDYY